MEYIILQTKKTIIMLIY